MLSAELIDSLFPATLPAPSHWEERYPPRSLPAGAEVTRFAPSPTGWLHIGAIFTAGVNLDIASHSGGRYLLRIEDTDQARFEEGALEQFEAGFAYFGIERRRVRPGLRRRRRVRAVHAVRPGGDLPELRARADADGQGVPVLRHQGGADGDRGAAEGGRRAARVLRRLGDLAGRARGAGAGAARRRRPVRGQVQVARDRRAPGQLHRRDPRRAQLRRQPQRRGHPEEQRPGAAAAHVPSGPRRRRPPDAASRW